VTLRAARGSLTGRWPGRTDGRPNVRGILPLEQDSAGRHRATFAGWILGGRRRILELERDRCARAASGREPRAVAARCGAREPAPFNEIRMIREKSEMPRHKHIAGREAARLAADHAEREPVRLLSSESGDAKELVESRSPSADQLGRELSPAYPPSDADEARSDRAS
jgi:hypothetical protein